MQNDPHRRALLQSYQPSRGLTWTATGCNDTCRAQVGAVEGFLVFAFLTFAFFVAYGVNSTLQGPSKFEKNEEHND